MRRIRGIGLGRCPADGWKWMGTPSILGAEVRNRFINIS